MTLNQLIKKLQKIKAKTSGRQPVVVDVEEIRSADYSHPNINDVSEERISWAVDDSFVLEDGSERYKTVVVLK